MISYYSVPSMLICDSVNNSYYKLLFPPMIEYYVDHKMWVVLCRDGTLRQYNAILNLRLKTYTYKQMFRILGTVIVLHTTCNRIFVCSIHECRIGIANEYQYCEMMSIGQHSYSLGHTSSPIADYNIYYISGRIWVDLAYKGISCINITTCLISDIIPEGIQSLRGTTIISNTGRIFPYGCYEDGMIQNEFIDVIGCGKELKILKSNHELKIGIHTVQLPESHTFVEICGHVSASSFALSGRHKQIGIVYLVDINGHVYEVTKNAIHRLGLPRPIQRHVESVKLELSR